MSRLGDSGRIGEGCWFSDLFARALAERLTGRILLLLEEGEGHVFFQDGNPIHTSGTALMHAFLGEILVQLGAITQEQLEAASLNQQESGGRSLLGELLRTGAGLTDAQVEAALRQQTARRTSTLFRAAAGEWRFEPREFPEVSSIAVPLDGYPLLLFGVRTQSSDEELRALSDALLGHAVQLKAPQALVEALAPSEADRKVLLLLQKPRKAHQLEQAGEDRRSVRALLKALHALEGLELLPQRAALPIKEAVKLAPPGAPGHTPPPVLERSPTPVRNTPEPAPKPRTPSRAEPPVLKELRQLHEQLRSLNHFELLGVKQDVNAADLRASFTVRAKKFHPDALGQLSPDAAEVARAVSAALNEAYNTLADPEARARYVGRMKQGNASVPEEQLAAQSGSARVKYEMGCVFLKKKDYTKARENLRFATDLAPQNGLYKGTYAWAMFSDPSFERADAIQKAEALLLEAIRAAPAEADLHYWLGCVIKERGDDKAAEECFKRALRVDEKHVKAERELRLSQLRRKDEGSGLLSKLFKR